MRGDYLGNVGIGTTSPSYKIDCRGAANTDVAIQVKASGTGDVDAELRLDAADTGESLIRYARDGTTRAISEYTNSNEWNFTTYNQDVIDFQPNSTHAMRIKYNGNVGIGNTTCADKLHVEGNVYLGTSSRSVYCGGGGNLRLQTGTGEVKVLTANGATTNLITSGTGINIPNDLDVGNALNVGGASAAGSGFIESTVVGPSRALQTVGNVNTTQTHIGFENLSGEVGRIDVDVFSVSYVTSSDYRLKTAIVPITGSIDRLKQLNPCNFQWIGTDTRVDGFIAHEAQEVVPEAVSGTKDATKIDKDGTEVPDYQGIDQAKLVPLLTAALQDAVARIEASEAEIQSLKTQMLTLQLPQ